MTDRPAAKNLLLDTVFIQALLNARDRYHSQARAILPQVRAAARVWVTEAVLLEVGAALSGFNREGAVSFIRQCYVTSNITVVNIDTDLLGQAIDLYAERPDKT